MGHERRSIRFTTIGRWLSAATAYVLLACGLTWPLPRHLTTDLLGPTTGDAGVYVWNLWIFRHELLRHGHLPFSTDHVFAYTGGADFALHNFTSMAGALALPLIGPLGLVGAFNVLLIVFIALAGLGVFALARRLGLGTLIAWAAGAMFMASPVLTAKETAHISLVNAAPLPLFLVALLNTLDSKRLRDAVLVGVTVAAAAYADAYYGIYCALMGLFLVTWRFSRVVWLGPLTTWPGLRRTIDTAIVVSALVIPAQAVSGLTEISVGSMRITLDTYYTPVLVLVLSVALRAWFTWRPVVRIEDPERQLARLSRLGLAAVGVCLTLQLPPLIGLASRYMNGRLPSVDVFWRSSPRGLDALSYLVPNPNHAWFGATTGSWLMPVQGDAFPEFVGSFSLVGLALIAAGAWLRVLPGFWVAFTALFASLSLGPFVHVAGANTLVIGPWALLRYVPVIGMARSPSRFAVVTALGLSVLCAFAIEGLHWRFRGVRWARTMGLPVALALGIELLPAPRRLYSAGVPDVYRLIASSEEDAGRLMELPVGVRDGTSTLGNFDPSTQYFQTLHRRPLIGGYLSRVSEWRKQENQRTPMLRALNTLSEGGGLGVDWREEARQSRDAFLEQACLSFVIVNKTRASQELQEFAVDALVLAELYQDDEYTLYTPVDPPPCAHALRPPTTSFGDVRRAQRSD